MILKKKNFCSKWKIFRKISIFQENDLGFLLRLYVYLRHEEREGDDHEGGVPGEEVRPRRGQVHHPPSQAQAQYVHNHSSLSLLQAL